MAACKACQERGQTWEGTAPTCSFPDGGEFISDGWNCATANLIRELVYEATEHPAVDHRYCDDQKYATICIDDVALPNEEHRYALWVSWYKNRGRTDAMWLLDSADAPRRPTEADCLAIVAALEARQ